MQCQGERRLRLPPAFACDRARPQWPQQSNSVRRRTGRPHSLSRPTGGPSAVRVGLDGLAPSGPSSGSGGLPLSPHDFHDFRQHRPRMRVDELDAPSRESVARAPLHVALRSLNWVFPVNACASDSLAASVFAVPVAPLSTFTDGTDFGQHAISSELSPSLHENAPHLTIVR